jgi:2-keto-4-pentenoate hydratase/2-oxohepta-3-ene-1,7-dioic acid hydratase in catechol pathway
MRYATFSLLNDPKQRVGVVSGNRILDLRKLVRSHWSEPFPASLQELIAAGPQAWRRMSSLVDIEEFGSQNPRSEISPPAEEIRLHAPIPRPAKNIVCLGLNYASHMEETAKARGRQVKIPEVPVFFTKATTTVNGPYDPIPWDPAVTSEVDWEAELAVILGVGGKNIPRAKAMEHVFGFTIANDVSARDLQQSHYQWFKGKSLDGFCPMGPHVVTADEFGDPQNKQISLRVNGVVKQSASTADMIFTVPVIIEFLSRGMTLEPGDIISTGTPEGVGLGRIPPEYLKDGDLIETEIEGIGVLRNQIVRRDL